MTSPSLFLTACPFCSPKIDLTSKMTPQSLLLRHSVPPKIDLTSEKSLNPGCNVQSSLGPGQGEWLILHSSWVACRRSPSLQPKSLSLSGARERERERESCNNNNIGYLQLLSPSRPSVFCISLPPLSRMEHLMRRRRRRSLLRSESGNRRRVSIDSPKANYHARARRRTGQIT